MELTYKVRGADGKEYGPATLDEIKAWLREGRISGQSEVTRSDIDYWAPASNFSEVGVPIAPVPTPAVHVPQAASVQPVVSRPVAAATAPRSDRAAEAHLKSGASWFYWIAGLSLINSAIALSGSATRFIVGLGLTQVFDGFAQGLGSSGGLAVAVVLDLLIAVVFVFFGVFANKRHSWAFIVGMILYSLDGLIFLVFQEWLPLAFHVFALWCVFRGFKACRELKAG